MARLMAWAHMAVTAGGTSSWELCFMGVPMLMIPVAENQVPIVRALTRAGASQEVGWYKDLDVKGLTGAIERLAGDARLRRRMSRAGRQLVDGRGADRVVSAMLGVRP
jgi:spore coat polysaccharide biosynthesis predicted glycosyltransferase SpsG